jgi:hypothetical protein
MLQLADVMFFAGESQKRRNQENGETDPANGRSHARRTLAANNKWAQLKGCHWPLCRDGVWLFGDASTSLKAAPLVLL